MSTWFIAAEALGGCVGILIGLAIGTGWNPFRRQPTEPERKSAAAGEPTRLTYEQFLPIAVALQRREHVDAGLRLPPFADCPTCGQTPAELAVRNDHPDFFLHDRIGFGFRPCGHTFTIDADDVHRANDAARYAAASEETP